MLMPFAMATKVQEPLTKSYYDADLYVNYVGVDKDRQRFDATFTCYSHPLPEIDFSGADIKEDYKEKNQYVLKVDNSKIPNENLALFIDVTYKGEGKSFYMYFNGSNRTFATNEKLDLKELTINKISAYREVNKGSNNNNSTSTMLWILLGIFLALILSAILVPVILTAVKKRR